MANAMFWIWQHAFELIKQNMKTFAKEIMPEFQNKAGGFV